MDSFNFSNGIIKKGSMSPGSGIPVGNIKNGIIRSGGSSSPAIGNVKDGIIRSGGGSSSPGTGTPIGNVKDGIIRAGNSASMGCGIQLGKVRDYMIKGMEREPEAEIVACYHFFIKKIF